MPFYAQNIKRALKIPYVFMGLFLLSMIKADVATTSVMKLAAVLQTY